MDEEEVNYAEIPVSLMQKCLSEEMLVSSAILIDLVVRIISI